MPDIAERSLHTRIGRSVEALRRSFLDNLFYVTGRRLLDCSEQDQYTALAFTIRDRLLARLTASRESHRNSDGKTVAYLSAEFLLGPHLGNNILNLGLTETVREALMELNLDLDQILAIEPEPGLGNGGLGRLAACYMDSMATQQIPAIGYGIRYEYGIFKQVIENGYQVEVADPWLSDSNPWELPRRLRYPVKLGGHVEHFTGSDGSYRARWMPASEVYGVAFDTPILGYGVLNVNVLRLWKSEAQQSFNLGSFNRGDYEGAVQEMVQAENISKVLYPNDQLSQGRELRLKQQYFFVSCSIQDMVRLTLASGGSIEQFPERFIVQLNDTHPSIAVAELMRLLLDDHHLNWDQAWNLSCRSFAYTNHTLLPEALETWELELIRTLLPRHLEIIFEINSRFLDEVRVRFINDTGRIKRMSLIDEGENGQSQRLRMAHLACVGSQHINGVAHLHSRLLKETVLKDFYELWPERFLNVTNGVTPRRFLAMENPSLSRLIDATIGGGWLRDAERLRQLENYSQQSTFCHEWLAARNEAKERLCRLLNRNTGVTLIPEAMFDVQVKRIHEYKRQLLNVLHIIHLYRQLRQNPNKDVVPRNFIFGGKAAPGYGMAKLIIKLIHSVAEVINNDVRVNPYLRVLFVPDFNVKTAGPIYPAADLSEQISTAGFEASGTGNMKMTMNGALTIGTLDGANIEIMEAVGEENFFLFGHSVESINHLRAHGYYPRDLVADSGDLQSVIELLQSGLFSHGDPHLFTPLVEQLLGNDYFMLVADFQDYIDTQQRVADAYSDPLAWAEKSILNVARSGCFSSDRAVNEYNQHIWHTKPHAVSLQDAEPPRLASIKKPRSQRETD